MIRVAFAEDRINTAALVGGMAKRNGLKTSLATAADTRRRLLDPLLAEALAPAEPPKLEAAA